MKLIKYSWLEKDDRFYQELYTIRDGNKMSYDSIKLQKTINSFKENNNHFCNFDTSKPNIIYELEFEKLEDLIELVPEDFL